MRTSSCCLVAKLGAIFRAASVVCCRFVAAVSLLSRRLWSRPPNRSQPSPPQSRRRVSFRIELPDCARAAGPSPASSICVFYLTRRWPSAPPHLPQSTTPQLAPPPPVLPAAGGVAISPVRGCGTAGRNRPQGGTRVSIHSGPPCPRCLPPRCGRTRYAASGFVTRDYASEASGMEGSTGREPGPPVRSVHPRGHPARLPRGVREAPTVTHCSEQLPIGKGTPRGRGKLRHQGSRPRSLPRPVHQRNAPTRACEQVWCHSQRPHPGKMAAHN